MNRCIGLSAALAVICTLAGCIDINLPENGLFVGSVSVVLKGTADVEGDCVIWRSEDARVFTLYQGTRVDNGDFDLVVTAGTQSRLLLDIRSDLGDPCLPDVLIANVDKILEIGGEDTGPAERALEKAAADIVEFKANLVEIVEIQREELQKRLGEFDESVRTFVNELEARVTESVDNLREQLEDREIPDRDQIVEDVRASLNALVNEIEGNLEGMLDDAQDQMQQFVESIRAELEERRGETEGRFEERLEEIKQELDDRLDDLKPNLDDLNARLEELTDELRDQLEEELTVLRSQMQQRIEEALDGVKEDVRQRLDELLAGIDPDLEDIPGWLEELMVEVRQVIEDRVAQFIDDVAEQLGLSDVQLQILKRTVQNLIEQWLGGDATTIETV